MKYFSILLGLFGSLVAAAQKTQVVAAADPFSGTSISKVALALGFTIGLIFAFAWLVKRLNRGSMIKHPEMDMIATMPLTLGGKDKLSLVKVGESYFLLGISPGRISKLHRFDQLPFKEQAKANQAGLFVNVLKKAMNHHE